jgi:hypothetical protein
MEKTKDGFGVYDPASDGGFASIGNGASRALPAGSWRTDTARLIPFNPVYDSEPGQEIDGPRIPVSRIPRPFPTKPVGPFTPDPSPTGPIKPPSDTQSLMDLFKTMFGASTGSNKPADSGAVVVYGDAAGGQPTMPPIVPLLIVGAVIGGGIWAWKKYA